MPSAAIILFILYSPTFIFSPPLSRLPRRLGFAVIFFTEVVNFIRAGKTFPMLTLILKFAVNSFLIGQEYNFNNSGVKSERYLHARGSSSTCGFFFRASQFYLQLCLLSYITFLALFWISIVMFFSSAIV